MTLKPIEDEGDQSEIPVSKFAHDLAAQIQALLTTKVREARIDEARKAKERCTIYFDKTGFDIAILMSERIAQLKQENKSNG